ncbi:MFS transporter [Thermoanaerobacter sp. A7A]|uniref:MFS transporter n=1 Tax=Thermoanaerobacter sp. A7A TaxID=1350366 RepID=UPI00042A0055|nr:MFS transporter [Thermoanaerobacter sp. A7A]
MESTSKRWSRIIPVAFVMYMTAYMDRINVAMILPYMTKSIHLSSADMGLAAGIFFIGYMILQIPGAILANKWSAKKVVFILMILWSAMAMATGLVKNATQLFIIRFLLGVFEGGVWPAVLVLLATWFPAKERARANAFWMINLPLSAIVMAPITGWLLSITNWRMVFFIEGLLPLLWAAVWWITIDDKPSRARWISEAEREYIIKTIEQENINKPKGTGYLSAFTNKTVLLLVTAYFFWMSGFYGYTMWVPSVVKSFENFTSFVVGLISAVPFAFAMIGMAINSSWSDKNQQREIHVAIPLIIGAFGLIGGQFLAHTPFTKMIFLIIAAIGAYSPYGPFWAIPTDILRPELAAAAMGLINAIGNLGGFLGPYIVGWIKGNYSGFLGFIVLGVFLLVTAIIALGLRYMNHASVKHSSVG